MFFQDFHLVSRRKSVRKVFYFQCRRNERRLLAIMKIVNTYNATIKSYINEKLLQVNFHSETNFQFHVRNLWFNTSRKLYAPARQMNTLFNSQFNYFPLVCACHNYKRNNQKKYSIRCPR